MKILIKSACVIALIVAVTFGGCSKRKPVIKMYDGSWSSIWIANAIAKVIIEDGYGYTIETREESEVELLRSFQSGNVDVAVEVWTQAIAGADELENNGLITPLGTMFETTSQSWVIPKWVADKYNIKTVDDMKNHWTLFQNPENPHKGIFYAGLKIWDVSITNDIKLKSYGLGKQYDTLILSSESVMEAAIVRAMEEKRPVFAYVWSPHYLNKEYDFHVLQEPEYDPEKWDKIIAATKDPKMSIDHACAYESYPVYNYVHKGMFKKAPDLVEMLKKMSIGTDTMNELLAWSKENKNWEKTAVHFFVNYEEKWKQWVTDDAYHNIKSVIDGRNQVK